LDIVLSVICRFTAIIELPPLVLIYWYWLCRTGVFCNIGYFWGLLMSTFILISQYTIRNMSIVRHVAMFEQSSNEKIAW